MRDMVDAVYRADSRRVLATLRAARLNDDIRLDPRPAGQASYPTRRLLLLCGVNVEQ